MRKARNTHNPPKYECSGWFKHFQVVLSPAFCTFLPSSPSPHPRSCPQLLLAKSSCHRYYLWSVRKSHDKGGMSLNHAGRRCQPPCKHLPDTPLSNDFQKPHSDDFRLGRPVNSDGHHALLWCRRQLRSLSASCCTQACAAPSTHTHYCTSLFSVPLRDRYPWVPLEASNFCCEWKL